jgi:serine/threonine protein kinase
MEFLEGEALASVLEREGPLEVARAMDIIVPVAAGLAAVHSEGIIHRDLKPENVILATSAGGIVPKIVDFGVSKDLLSSAGSSHTVAGTPTHMAPEQARGGAVDGRADEYSLALIAYQCLTGTLPYQAGSLLELMQLIELGEYRCIRELRPQVPVNLELVIQRAMMSVAEARFPTIVDFGSALLPFASPVVVSRYAYELNKTGNDPDREVSPPQGAVQSLPGEQAKNVSDREPDVRAVAPITPQSLSRAGANAFKSDRMIRRTLIGSFVLLALAAIAVASYLRRHREGGTVRPAGRAEERISSEQHVSSVTVFPQASGLPQGGSRAVASRAVPTPSSPPANPKKTRQSTKQGTASATDLGINLTRSGQPSNATSE